MTKDNEKYQAYDRNRSRWLMRLQRQEKYWDVCRTESVSEQAEVSLRM